MKKLLLITSWLMFVSFPAKPQSWITQNVNPLNDGYNFICMSAVDNMTALGIGFNYGQTTALGYFLSKTSDGGTTWTSSALGTNYFPTSFQALSSDTAWISINYDNGSVAQNWYGSLLKTTDGGNTWINNSTIPFDSTSYVDMVHFFNSNEGVAFGDALNGSFEVYYTSNGGTTWGTSIVPPALSGEYGLENHYCVYGNNIWITSSEGRVLHSTDKGVNWTVSQIDAFNYPTVCRVAFYDAMEGIAVAYDSNFSSIYDTYRTHDGGITWSQQSYSGNLYQAFYGGLFIVPGSNVLISNASAQSVFGSSYSVDSGLTWNNIDVNGYGAIDGKGWNSLWTGQFTATIGVGGVAKWDGVPLGMKQNETALNFSISPNPSNGKFTIEMRNHTNNKLKISVENITGKKVFENEYEKNNDFFIQKLDLKIISSGIYFVKVFDGESSIFKKLIVEQD